MEAELYEAAMKGNVRSLLELLRRDEMLLDTIMTGYCTETPLHIATMLGHLDFVDQVLARKPEMAREQDSQGSTPLHLATANGDLTIVASLLRASPEMCFIRDKYRRNPLHVAAMKGHVDVLKHLVEARPYAAYSFVECDQTILHLCVKHNRLEALKLLIDTLGNDRLINYTDGDGNTILHLAVVHKQTETVDFLISKGVSPCMENSKDFTALGLPTQGESVRTIHPPEGEEDERERKIKWANSMREALLVVATLIATMAYQASITPPGGLWQEDSQDNNKNGLAQAPAVGESDNNNGTSYYYAGESIMAHRKAHKYKSFVAFNTISFIASLSVIMLIISGLSLRHRITTWIAMLTLWVAIFFMAANYTISIFDITAANHTHSKSPTVMAPTAQRMPKTPAQVPVLAILAMLAVLVFVGFMVFTFLRHFIRLIRKV